MEHTRNAVIRCSTCMKCRQASHSHPDDLAVGRPRNVADCPCEALAFVLDGMLGVVERPDLHHSSSITRSDVSARGSALHPQDKRGVSME